MTRIAYRRGGKPFRGITISSRLAIPAGEKDMDQWEVTLSNEHASVVTPYQTGVGLRLYPSYSNPFRRTMYDIENSQAIRPDARDVLESLCLDAFMYLEARDEEKPLDYLAQTFGFQLPSEAQRIFKGCRHSWHLLRKLKLDPETLNEELQE